MIHPNGGDGPTARSLRWDSHESALNSSSRSHLGATSRPVDFGPRPTSYVPVHSLARLHDEAVASRRIAADLGVPPVVDVMRASAASPSDLPNPASRLHSYMAMLKSLRGTPAYVGDGTSHRPRSSEHQAYAATMQHEASSIDTAGFSNPSQHSVPVASTAVVPQRSLTSPMPGAASVSNARSTGTAALGPLASSVSAGQPNAPPPSSLGLLAERIRVMLEREASDRTARQEAVVQRQVDHTVAASHSLAYRTEELRQRLTASNTPALDASSRQGWLPPPPPGSGTNSLQVSPIRGAGDRAPNAAIAEPLPGASVQYIRALESRVAELESQHRSHQSFVATSLFQPPPSHQQQPHGVFASQPSSPRSKGALAPPPVLLARVTLPFLVKGADPAAAPSFVVQIADLDQSGPALLAYLVQQARIRFPHAWESTSRSLAPTSTDTSGYRRTVHPSNVVLYCAGSADLDVPPPGAQYQFDHEAMLSGADGGALLLVEGASLNEYRVVKFAEERCTSGTVTAAMRRMLLASRTLHQVAASDVPPNPVLGSSELLTGHLFDMELFIFERNAIPAAHLTQEALRRGLRGAAPQRAVR